ncbi:hypothetical protein NJT12_04920 [Flavobacterium sp. AC]|uniref:Initiator Rep protein domain-containing protein n=1 Tax=Flavobacterium azizsancarii TaxID=2961580 RepID=A0ABT4W8T3_9FLAO|nr:hypothetical protein [Flavobacterium azizsancarii]MDA6068959.1 hypothetical protein [Flavobacterium azizsancarii]
MKTIIPTELLTVITNQINIDTRFVNISINHFQSLAKQLVTLWYFIYTNQQSKITDENEVTLHFYTNIHRDELKHFKIKINKKEYSYASLIDVLQSCNVIKVNNKYSNSETPFTKGYKINTYFLSNSNHTEFEIDFKKIFRNTREKQYWLDIYPQYKHLIEDVYQSSVNLDDYLYWLQKNIGIDLKKTKRKTYTLPCGKKIIKTEKQYLTPERIYQHFHQSLKLNFKNVWFAVSNEGRFYNSVSNIPSTAVQFLKISGAETFNVDISNSQPLLLSVLLSDEQTAYKNDVQNGVFYQKVADFMGCERPYFKGLSYQFVFFNDNVLKSGMIFDALEEIYPGLIHEINQIKTKSKLACQLQAMEADIFVNKIGKLDFPKLLRHDQVIVTKENFEIVQQELVQEYKKLGLKVTF